MVCLSQMHPLISSQLPFTTSIVFESTLKLEVLHILLQMKLIPWKNIQSSLFYSMVLPQAKSLSHGSGARGGESSALLLSGNSALGAEQLVEWWAVV